LDDKSEEHFQKVCEYLIAICEFIKTCAGGKIFWGRRPQTITWYVFRCNSYSKPDSAVR
jgi:hypothetical protein